MIIVTGTKRSGTSMWMQILIAAGFPHIGDAFSADWERSIKEANSRGFFESKLRKGIYYATNPEPESGLFLHPQATRGHAVKVLIPGVIRTDYAYMDRVIATLRGWREYTRSVQRLYALEERYAKAQSLELNEDDAAKAARFDRLRKRIGNLPPPVEWWFEIYDLVRDVAVRRYPFNWVTYQRLIEDPEREITSALRWIGAGNIEAAVAAVDPSMRTQKDTQVAEPGIDAEAIAVFDELYDAVNRHGKLPADLLARMNTLQQNLREQWKNAGRRDDAILDGES